MSRPNYYILLELGESERDADKIEVAIQKKRSDWASASIHPTKGPQATKNLAMIPDIRAVLTDPEKREAEAQEAAQLRREERRRLTSELDEAIDVLASKGYLWKKELESLIKQFRGKFSEAEVRKRISVSVRENDDPSPPKAVLEPSAAKRIRERLRLLGKKDLYDFLGAERTASLTQLQNQANKIYRDALDNNNKTAEVAASEELAGDSKQLFKDELGREKYNNTLAQQRLLELDPLIEAAGASGHIESQVVERLLYKARELGIALDDALQHLRDFARPRNWAVEVPKLSETKAATLLQCGKCGVLNEARAKVCRDCGSPLWIDCPKCQARTASDHAVCVECGFRIGDVWTVRRLVGDADRALKRGAVQHAAECLHEAELLWPEWEEIHTRLKEVHKRQDEQRELVDRLRVSVAERRLEEAARLLASCREKDLLGKDLETLQTGIESGLEMARRMMERARNAARNGRSDEAVDGYLDVLRECQDYREALEGLAKCPPEPPGALQATPTVHVVALSWQASVSRGELQYCVVRKEASAPRGVSDGHRLSETAATSLTDSDATPGILYYYGVFAQRGGTPSRSAAVCGPVLRVAEVSNLNTTSGDGSVSLTWHPPGKVGAIEVWRDAGAPPRRRGEGTRLTTVTSASAMDRGLTNGTFYGYRVVAVFGGTDGQPVYSEGVTVSVAPAAPPEPIKNLQVAREGARFEVTWSPPPAGNVEIFVADAAPTAKCGDLLASADLKSLGKAATGVGPGKAAGRLDGREVRFLVPVTVAGSTRVLGQFQTITWVDDVLDLDVKVEHGVMTAWWKWPVGIDSVLVAARADRFPTDPYDPRATREFYRRFKYDRNGGYRRSMPTLQRIYLSVYAAVQVCGAWQYASGATVGCRKEVVLARCRTLRYAVRVKRQFVVFGPGQHTLTIMPDAAAQLPEMVLVAKSGGLPLHPQNGREVLRIPAGTTCAPDQPLELAFKPPPATERWRVRLFPLNDADAEWLTLEAIN